MATPNTPPFSGAVTPRSDGEILSLDSPTRKRPRLTPESPGAPIHVHDSSDNEEGAPTRHQPILVTDAMDAVVVIDSSDDDFEYAIDDEDDDVDNVVSDLGFSDGDDIEGSNMEHPPLLGLESLEEDIAYAECMLEGTGITLQLVLYDLIITIPLDLPQSQHMAYGLMTPDPIRVILQFTGYRRGSDKPSVVVRHGDPKYGTGIETSSFRVHAGFPIGLKLTQTALNFLRDRWSARGQGFLSDLALRLNDRLINAGNTCVMCDIDLPFPGVKPTVCDNHLCAYQLDNLGLGADLSLFDTDPKVADLLITAAVAACNDVRRLQVSPVVTPVKRSPGNPTGGDSHYSPPELARLLNSLPSAEVLHDAGPQREALLKECDADAAFVTGWVFATNRAHIVSLEEEKQIQSMQTAHQFQIHTSTRKHAEKFEALRAQHGSFWAFHGTPMSNWHNILRQNLKNASKTPLMSTGAAYGEGIYLGASSRVSSLYARGSVGWQNSALGDAPVCLALVEVANSSRVHHHGGGSIIVASDENCVMLRQLFVYPNGFVPVVEAKDIAQARFKNQTTIAFGSSFEEVQASGKLLITSDDYFWDIDEVVEMVKAKNGLFINPYNQLPFAQKDVDAIMHHRSGAGNVLAEIEKENAKLKQRISPEVFDRLHQVGRLCVIDNSTDFAAAMGAIAELRDWLAQRPAAERDALERVPFQATDSHTRIPFRNTVSHAIELVVSGGECTHRFGDFLSQVK